jgi:hypothetical protein
MFRKAPATAPSIRRQYETRGVGGFYTEDGATYRNPHEPGIRQSLLQIVPEWELDLSHVLDLAAGSGEATLVLRELGAGQIDGIDPYTHEAYFERTGAVAGRETFETIADGALIARRYSLIICSFALHLVERSRLPQLAYQLSCISRQLLVLTPHKRPVIREAWGWKLTHETVCQRVRSRLYRSTG